MQVNADHRAIMVSGESMQLNHQTKKQMTLSVHCLFLLGEARVILTVKPDSCPYRNKQCVVWPCQLGSWKFYGYHLKDGLITNTFITISHSCKFLQVYGPSIFNWTPEIYSSYTSRKKTRLYVEVVKWSKWPIRLGWGTTIHRYQGMIIDVGEITR